MEKAELRLLWMYPDILNLHGGRGDVMAVERLCRQLGVALEVRRVNRLAERPDFTWADLLVFGPGELCVLPKVKAALLSGGGALEAYAAAGKGILCVGTTGALFARETRRCGGASFEGLGLLDMVCTEREMPYGDDVIFRAGGLDRDVCGIQIQMVDTALAPGQEALGPVVYGHGNDGGGMEGAVRAGVVFTNALGPVLVKNPWFALWLLKKLVPALAPLPEPDDDDLSTLWELESESARAILAFNEKKEKGHAPKA
ncbi:MAG: hypothetical protein LBR44_02380 [Clostridiales Family XIII bacterium]|jgi:CobQ-like glutamine amidotransferase family enzyme|nr:hypothetical protein [Clostridiales Family XIII bacterium]